jgi:hypothetical protein
MSGLGCFPPPECADDFESLSHLPLKIWIRNELPKLSNLILQNECVARATNLMLLSLDDSGFFETPDLDDMLKCITDSPETIIRHLVPEQSQSLSLMIIRVHQNIAEFAHLLTEHFKNDTTLLLAFSYSTFPAIFGFFTLESLSDLAAQLILMLIDNSQVRLLTHSMITMFFSAMHKFFAVIWVNIVSHFSVEMPKQQVYELFLRAVGRAVPYLTRCHIQVLQVFTSYHPPIVGVKLILEILTDRLTAQARYGSQPMNPADLKFVIQSIQSASAADHERLLALLCGQKKFTRVLPDVAAVPQLRQIPLVLSDRDVHTLCDIIGFESDIGKQSRGLLKTLNAMYQRGYAPFHGNIAVPKWCHSRRTWSTHVPPRPHKTISRFEHLISLRELQQELVCWHDFLVETHGSILNRYAAITVAKSVRPKKREKPSADDYFSAVFSREVHPALFKPLLFAVLDTVQPDGSPLLSFERIFTKVRSSMVPQPPRLLWLEREVLACFRCPHGCRIAKLLLIAEEFHQFFREMAPARFQSLLAVLQPKDLLKTLAQFKHHVIRNAAVRQRLQPAADLLDAQFALACKFNPQFYFQYTNPAATK